MKTSFPQHFPFLVVGSLLLLAGCENTHQTSPVEPWPNLATVPPRPKEFSTPEELAALRARLEKDRAAAQQQKSK